MKIKHGEIETRNYRIFWSFRPWGRDENTGEFEIWPPKFKFKNEKTMPDYSTRYYEWALDIGYITILKKHHPVYDEAAKKYNWNTVL